MTLYPQVRLECDGLDPFIVDEALGVFGQTLDTGDAVTRAVAEDAPDAHGTIDSTEFTGARNVTLQLILYPDADLWALKRKLRAFTAAGLRPTMFLQESATAPLQQITLRRSQYSDVLGSGPRAATQADPEAAVITVQWVAPFGILESAGDAHVAIALATASGAEGGFTFDMSFDLTFTGGTVIGETEVLNAGDADAYPLIRLYGPAGNGSNDIELAHVESGKSLVFTNLQILAGEFLEIDTRAKTIRYLGNASDSRYENLNFPASAWWSLAPGINTLRYLPDTYSEPAQAQIVWRDAYL